MCSVGGLGGVITWFACYYYCYCYYWITILKKKVLSAYLYKNEKMFKIDLNSDLKEEFDLKSSCCFTLLWTGNSMILNVSESQCGQICLVTCNFVNKPEYA